MELIREGSAEIRVFKHKISRKMPVFYNKIMKKNRDISILLLKALKIRDMVVADPLAGSGIRAIRFMLELDNVREIHVNDYADNSIQAIRENLERNGLGNDSRIKISQTEANIFLMRTKGFHYIDIDPFGSPNPFLDAAAKKIARNGIMAVTATDTSALCGTYPRACKRKYWAVPKRDELMHETGLRILIRKVQLVGAQYDKALIPVLSYSSDHYTRVFFASRKGKSRVDKMLAEHNMFNNCGPMWTGNMWDSKLVRKMIRINDDKILDKFLTIIYEESRIGAAGFYNLHAFCKRHNLRLKKTDEIKKEIIDNGYSVSGTHFTPLGIRSDIPEEELVRILQTKHDS